MDSRDLQAAYDASKSRIEGLRKQVATKVAEKSRNSFELVVEFMLTFGHPVYSKPQAIEDADWLHMRLGLIREELAELYEACGYETAEWLEHEPVRMMNTTDVVGAADALGDLEYVVNGMAAGMGINLPEVVREIHRSNMTKLGPDGKPIYREDGKILKGEGYEPPNLEKVLYKD